MIILEFKADNTIIVVAELLWISAVMPVPSNRKTKVPWLAYFSMSNVFYFCNVEKSLKLYVCILRSTCDWFIMFES